MDRREFIKSALMGIALPGIAGATNVAARSGIDSLLEESKGKSKNELLNKAINCIQQRLGMSKVAIIEKDHLINTSEKDEILTGELNPISLGLTKALVEKSISEGLISEKATGIDPTGIEVPSKSRLLQLLNAIESCGIAFSLDAAPDLRAYDATYWAEANKFLTDKRNTNNNLSLASRVLPTALSPFPAIAISTLNRRNFIKISLTAAISLLLAGTGSSVESTIENPRFEDFDKQLDLTKFDPIIQECIRIWPFSNQIELRTKIFAINLNSIAQINPGKVLNKMRLFYGAGHDDFPHEENKDPVQLQNELTTITISKLNEFYNLYKKYSNDSTKLILVQNFIILTFAAIFPPVVIRINNKNQPDINLATLLIDSKKHISDSAAVILINILVSLINNVNQDNDTKEKDLRRSFYEFIFINLMEILLNHQKFFIFNNEVNMGYPIPNSTEASSNIKMLGYECIINNGHVVLISKA